MLLIILSYELFDMIISAPGKHTQGKEENLLNQTVKWEGDLFKIVSCSWYCTISGCVISKSLPYHSHCHLNLCYQKQLSFCERIVQVLLWQQNSRTVKVGIRLPSNNGVMIFSSRHPFRVRDGRHTPSTDSSKINNAPVTNQSTILISTGIISCKSPAVQLTPTKLLRDEMERNYWGAMCCCCQPLLPRSEGGFYSVMARNASHWSSVSDCIFDLQDKGGFEAFCIQNVAKTMMTWSCNDGGRYEDLGEERINLLMITVIVIPIINTIIMTTKKKRWV